MTYLKYCKNKLVWFRVFQRNRINGLYIETKTERKRGEMEYGGIERFILRTWLIIFVRAVESEV